MTSKNRLGPLRRAGAFARAAARTGLALTRQLGEAGAPERAEPPRDPLRSAMKKLLASEAAFDAERAREDLYLRVLRQLTPDEARILSVLATGAEFPVIDVVSHGRMVVRQSTVGEAAGVVLPSEVPSYLARLAGFGLVDFQGENPALGSKYEILMTDELVREALSTAKRPKQLRRTVYISRFGARFWAAADPSRTRVR